MTTDQDLALLETELASHGLAHRAFFVPIVRAIAELGGRARKRDVVKKIRELLADELNVAQLDHLESNNRFGWAKSGLKKNGLVGGEYGYWELTELGRAYEAAHRADPLTIEADVPEASAPARSTVRTQPVSVTAFRAYEIPLLEVLADGVTVKREFIDLLGSRLKDSLLPGDLRLMPGGQPVWKFRAHWATSSLGKAGFAENTGTARWKITAAGSERLQRERETWNIRSFPDSQAMVRVQEGEVGEATPPPAWEISSWNHLKPKVSKSLFAQLSARLRPELGPSPDVAISRNIILYGPPGTGKTFRAKQIARALTGEDEVGEDGRLRLVQFHPSYAYEDFVQGLRPDLKQTELRYQLQKGPFLNIAEAAAQEPNEMFVLIIDEINRGDPARIFGELLYALEYREEPVSLPLGGELVVPSNLVVIGTMNSVDRSVALVDYALRRRFGFIRVDPEPNVIAKVRVAGLLADAGPQVLEGFNGWVAKRLGKEYVIGHSYFLSATLSADDNEVFDQLWRLDVGPLLEEYFYGDEDGLGEAAAQWKKVVAGALETRAELQEEDRAESEAAPA